MPTNAAQFIPVAASPELAKVLASEIDAGGSASVTKLMNLGGLPPLAAQEVVAQIVAGNSPPANKNERLMAIGFTPALSKKITDAIAAAYP